MHLLINSYAWYNERQQRTCYISCILKSGTTLTSIFLDESCVNSRQCSFMTQGRYWTPIDPLATLKGVSRGPSKANHAGDVTGPLQLYYVWLAKRNWNLYLNLKGSYKSGVQCQAQMPRRICWLKTIVDFHITPQGFSPPPFSAPLRVMSYSCLAAVSLFHVGW